MKRITAAVVLVLTLGAAAGAHAGIVNGDDENDYEGRVEGNQNTYFGFDVSPNGNKVRGITAVLEYRCPGGDAGVLLVETDRSLRVKDGEFSGATFKEEGEVTVTYVTTGKFGNSGKAKGTIRAMVAVETTTCRAQNDGEWQTREGKDIDLIER